MTDTAADIPPGGPYSIDGFGRFMRLRAVVESTGLSKYEIYRRIREGTFPRSYPYRDSSSCYWVERDIIAWKAEELAKSRARSARTA